MLRTRVDTNRARGASPTPTQMTHSTSVRPAQPCTTNSRGTVDASAGAQSSAPLPSGDGCPLQRTWTVCSARDIAKRLRRRRCTGVTGRLGRAREDVAQLASRFCMLKRENERLRKMLLPAAEPSCADGAPRREVDEAGKAEFILERSMVLEGGRILEGVQEDAR